MPASRKAKALLIIDEVADEAMRSALNLGMNALHSAHVSRSPRRDLDTELSPRNQISTKATFPYDIWLHIADHLELTALQLQKLLSLNQAFFHAAINRAYRYVDLYTMNPRHIHLARRLQSVYSVYSYF